MEPRKREAIGDLMKSVNPLIVPAVARMIVSMVPAGTKLDRFLDNYANYWEKIAPTVSMLVLRLTDAPEFVDDIVVGLASEVSTAIKMRYTVNGKIVDKKSAVQEGFTLEMTILLIPKEKSNILLRRVNHDELSKEQKSGLRNYVLSSEKTDALIAALNLTTLTKAKFLEWANFISPKEGSRQETELEKKVKEGLEEFKVDAKNYFQRDSYFVRLAKQKGLM